MEPERDPAKPAATIDGRIMRPVPARLRRFLVENQVESRPHAATEPLWLNRGVWLFVALGLILRTIRYAQNLPLWSDECFLAVNFLQRGFRELLEPLDNGQIAPLLFLWAERAAVVALGFSEWSLRLGPIACGLASMLLFERLARATLRRLPLLLAVGVFAVSVHPIRHAAEAKPYASDLLTALLLLGPAVAWLNDPSRSRRLWLLAALTPFCLALSNPAVFVLGAIIAVLAMPVWKSGRWSDRLALASCLASFVGLSVVLHLGFGRTQSAGAIAGLQNYWSSGFPPLGTPWKLPGWLLAACTGSMFAYPGGGAHGLSTVTFLAFVAGAAVLTRQGKGRLVVCLIAPFGLTLLASVFHRYPFGTEARLMQFAAPAVCLLSGAGAGAAIEWIRSAGRRRRVLGAVLTGLVACGIAPQVVSSMIPYRMLHDQEAREFARRFWAEQGRDAELACAHLDFGLDSPGWQGRQAWYLCNQAIYSPQRRAHGGPRLDRVSTDHPLRCVVFEQDPDGAPVRAWLARMRTEYDLRSQSMREPLVTLGDPARQAPERWRIYEFIPRSKPTGEENHVPMETSNNER
ncbi:hypothetical protein BSF38_01659 [Paludisphaera borealis]|uniref:Glycosyltransferase RgtA/B/C/D-like domain-containing protein n=1 Tax=Paludisphaera borealis TaxID=1387353 RepID=A0A1U7CMT4_9BACT|nr:hypothetical protein BSF38_01659 [Paludisphaera borealis]